MLPFRKILCPSDFSEPSYEALQAAGELAIHFGSELCILHVVSPVPLMPIGVEPTAFNVVQYEEELMASSKKSLEQVLHQLERGEVKARLITVRGNAADEIVRIATEEHVDLIVIATRGRTGWDRLIFGSVTEKVVRLADCPVLTVLTVTSQPSKEETKEVQAEKGQEGRIEPGATPLEGKQEKDTYQEKVEAQLKEWGNKIEELKAKAEKSKVEAKETYLKQVEKMKDLQESAKQKLHEIKDSGGEAWEEVKVGLDKVIEELKDTFSRVRSKF